MLIIIIDSEVHKEVHDGDTIYSQTGGGNDWSQVICPAILGRGTGTTDSQKRIGTPLLHRI